MSYQFGLLLAAFIDRAKQMVKAWNSLSQEQQAPFFQQARDNQTALRIKRAQV